MKIRVLSAVLLPVLFVMPSRAAEPIHWRTDYKAALAESKKRNLPMLVEVTTSHCPYCVALSKVLADPSLAETIEAEYVPLRIDQSREPYVVAKLGIRSFPELFIAQPNRSIVEWAEGYQPLGKVTDMIARHTLAAQIAPDCPLGCIPIPQKCRAINNQPDGVCGWTAATTICNLMGIKAADGMVAEMADRHHGYNPDIGDKVFTERKIPHVTTWQTSTDQLHKWVDSGVPVAVSIPGHEVVVTGFTPQGDFWVLQNEGQEQPTYRVMSKDHWLGRACYIKPTDGCAGRCCFLRNRGQRWFFGRNRPRPPVNQGQPNESGPGAPTAPDVNVEVNQPNEPVNQPAEIPAAPASNAPDYSADIAQMKADIAALKAKAATPGPKGDTGQAGPQGPKGSQGDPGPAGSQGPAGSPVNAQAVASAVLNAIQPDLNKFKQQVSTDMDKKLAAFKGQIITEFVPNSPGK